MTGGGDREAMVRRFKLLTEDALPARAREERWPLRLDHCFKRVCLDWACGGCWYDHIRRPAERYIDGDLLSQAVLCAEEILAGGTGLLQERNGSSLRWRGKLDRRGQNASEPQRSPEP